MITIQIEMARPPMAEGSPLGLLVPEPINTGEQRFVGYEMPCSWTVDKIACQNTGQLAMFVSSIPDETIRLNLVFTKGDGAPPSDNFFSRVDNHYTAAPDYYAAQIRACAAGVENKNEAIRRVVNYVADHFDYSSLSSALELPACAGQTVTGNCVAINTAFLAACYAVDIDAFYQAGFFFEQQRIGAVADGMHCWVTTRAGGCHDHWDISHCLRAGIHPVIPGLNPAGGVRVAMSHGRGLEFKVAPEVSIEISHFAQPRWIYGDGRTETADVKTRLVSLGRPPVRRQAPADKSIAALEVDPQ